MSLDKYEILWIGWCTHFLLACFAYIIYLSSKDLRISPSIRNNKFLDYVKGDCDLRLCVGIDFTRSNGNPKNQESLHYLSNNGNKNDYEKAISAIGNILANFNRSKKFPGESLVYSFKS